MSLVVVAEVLGRRSREGREEREEITTELLLETARSRGFSLQGEMFSVFSLASLARDLLEVEARVEPASLLLDTSWLLELLQSGGLAVLPYDCQPDSSVCLAGGDRAHWGVITGLITPSDSPPQPACRPLAGVKAHHILQSSAALADSQRPELAELVRLVVRQSKSLELAIYSR